LLAGGVDGFILETFSDLEEIHAALRAVRAASNLPVVCQMTVGTDGLTYYGTDPETFAKLLTEWGADVIGVNCSVGPAGVLEAVEKMVKVTDRPIAGQPNAGDWTPEKDARLNQLVRYAHAHYLWIRFYTLDGATKAELSCNGWFSSYNFGSKDAVQKRWEAAAKAGADYIATDQYEVLDTLLKARK